jgi:hypothetical protein
MAKQDTPEEVRQWFVTPLARLWPAGGIGVWGADRGDARSLLLPQREREDRRYMIRGRTNTLENWGWASLSDVLTSKKTLCYISPVPCM